MAEPYFRYDNPEYQGCILPKGQQAAGTWIKPHYSRDQGYREEEIGRQEGLNDPNFRVTRIAPGMYANAPAAVFTGTCPKPEK